jgi:formamidopyrimidine-DNA glycosylase
MVGKLGPNALDLSLEEFRALLKGRRGAIKTFLLDQGRIAGIGTVTSRPRFGGPRSTPCGRSRP